MRIRALLAGRVGRLLAIFCFILGTALWVHAVLAAVGLAQGPAQCADHVDNDGDGRIDFPMDSGCANPVDAEEGEPFGGVPECADGIDNDSNGVRDYPADRGCVSAADPRETSPPTAAGCSDGQDNDGDGVKDYPLDKGCIAAADPFEQNVECSDGVDNDGDGKVDHPADDGCSVPSNAPDQVDNSEGGVLPVDVPAGSTAPGAPPGGGMPAQPSSEPIGKANVTLKVSAMKPRKGKVRFVFTGSLRDAPVGARVAIRVREHKRWKQFRSPRVVDGRFKTQYVLRRSGRRWCFQVVSLWHERATYTQGRSSIVCRRAR